MLFRITVKIHLPYAQCPSAYGSTQHLITVYRSSTVQLPSKITFQLLFKYCLTPLNFNYLAYFQQRLTSLLRLSLSPPSHTALRPPQTAHRTPQQPAARSLPPAACRPQPAALCSPPVAFIAPPVAFRAPPAAQLRLAFRSTAKVQLTSRKIGFFAG